MLTKSKIKMAMRGLFSLVLFFILIFLTENEALLLIPVMWIVSEFHIRQNEKVKKELHELKNKIKEVEVSLSKKDNVNLWSGVGKNNNN